MNFDHRILGQKVRFGTNKAASNVAAELEELSLRRPMIIAGEPERHLAETVCAEITPVVWWGDVVQHVPLEVVEAARAEARQHDIDVIISVGGGSTTGLAKAVALTSGLPIIAVPTTYAGSEATNVWGITEAKTKTTGVDDRVLPKTVVYDANLSKSLPKDLSVASGLNGMAHCIDSLWAPKSNPINQAFALEGARALALALRGISLDPNDLQAREQALYGSYLAAVSFASAGSGLHHKICHVLGGTFDLPHAETHATILPFVLSLNAPAVPQLSGRLANAVSSVNIKDDVQSKTAVETLRDLYENVEAPTRLKDYGFAETDIPEAVRRILEAAPNTNPVEVTEENLTDLLTAATLGQAANQMVH